MLDWAEKVAVSGETQGEWAEIVVGDKGLWVHKEYLAEKKPKPEPEPKAETTEGSTPVTSGLSSAVCADGTDVESGLDSNAVARRTARSAQPSRRSAATAGCAAATAASTARARRSTS